MMGERTGREKEEEEEGTQKKKKKKKKKNGRDIAIEGFICK